MGGGGWGCAGVAGEAIRLMGGHAAFDTGVSLSTPSPPLTLATRPPPPPEKTR